MDSLTDSAPAVSKGHKTPTQQQLHNTDFSIVPVYMALTQGVESRMQHVHLSEQFLQICS